MFPLDMKVMIWMTNGDVVAADGMVMFSLSVLWGRHNVALTHFVNEMRILS